MQKSTELSILNTEGLLRWGQIKSTLRPGRPVIASARDKRGLIKIVKKDRTQTLFNVTDRSNGTTNLSVSSSTVRRYIHELGYYGRAGLRKPLISEKKQKRSSSMVSSKKKIGI
ncbi:2171_t:CDS:2 [Entrophospora sp. SA101]|nr:2171_t:CDS:2 [Entrophospora sp. SA101]